VIKIKANELKKISDASFEENTKECYERTLKLALDTAQKGYGGGNYEVYPTPINENKLKSMLKNDGYKVKYSYHYEQRTIELRW